MKLVSERHVKVSDDPLVELFVAQTSGPADRTLLVVHGGPVWDHTYLLEPLLGLGGERRVVFADLRGCGRSTRGLPGPAHTPAAAVNDLSVLIDELGGPVDVLGFSYGGMLVQRLLVTAPTKVRRAVIASSSILPVTSDAYAGYAERDARLARLTPTPEPDGPWDDDRLRRDAVTSAALNIWRLDLLPHYLDVVNQVQFSADWANAWPDRSHMPPARPHQVVEELRDLDVPLLLLHGRQDMTFPAALVQRTTELIPAARGTVLENAGHMAHIDQPDAWLDAVSRFLSAAP